MILTAVFLLSLSALSFEILLVRVFSISQWNHLSFMVISITLFGFAAGGTCLNIIDTRKKDWEKHLSSIENIHIFTILFTLSAIISFMILNRIPLDYISVVGTCPSPLSFNSISSSGAALFFHRPCCVHCLCVYARKNRLRVFRKYGRFSIRSNYSCDASSFYQ